MRSIRAAAVVLVLAAGTACGSEGEGEGEELSVYTSVYPLEWLTSELGGSDLTVTSLTEPGTDPHNLELSPQQIGELTEADLVVYISGMQPAVDDAVDQHAADRAFDVAEAVELHSMDGEEHEDEEGHGEEHEDEDGHGEEEGAHDPHVWLDPVLFAEVAEALGPRLAELGVEADPAAAEELADIDAYYGDALAECASQEFVVSHAAFGYLAERYDLDEIAVSGIEPDSEPSPARISEVAELVEDHEISTVFTEVLASEQVADVLAEETGVDTAVLDPLEGITEDSPGEDYPSVMRANADALGSALDCAA